MKGINVQWKAIFPGHLLQSTAAGISDHCPLVLSLNSNLVGKRRFHFEPFWPTLEGFQEVVQQAWASTAHTGCPIERLDAKIRATARTLQAWSQKKVGNVTAQLEQARDLLHHLEVAQDRCMLSWPSLGLPSSHYTDSAVKTGLVVGGGCKYFVLPCTCEISGKKEQYCEATGW